MIGTGKYNFPGIRKAGAAALSAVLASTTWGAAVLAGPFKPVIDLLFQYISEWLANRGLVIINVGAIYINGEFDQAKFDQAFQDGIEKSKAPGLSTSQKKVIDDEVIKAFRHFTLIGKPGLPTLSDV